MLFLASYSYPYILYSALIILMYIYVFLLVLSLILLNSNYKGKNKKLETACEYYGIENKNAHRADSDTLATANLFLILNK